MLTEWEALTLYLADGPGRTADGRMRAASFRAALVDARNVTGRNPNTGDLERPEHSGSWIGAIGYLCFLDQVGTAVFRPSRQQSPDSRGVVAAFHSFLPRVPMAEREALYALRCALAHDYSLVNWHRRPSMRHLFVLHPAMGPLVRLPQRIWSGADYAQSLTEADSTHVSMTALAEHAEAVAADVRDAYYANDLAIALQGGVGELCSRYFFGIGSVTA